MMEGFSMKKPQMLVTSMALIGTLFGSSVSWAAQAASTAAKNANTYPLHVTDEAGHSVTISKKPDRIASGTEGTDEILSALVPKQDLVLVTSASANSNFSNITTYVKGLPQMSSANAEQIIASKPDVVFLASYTKPGVVNQVQQAGIATYELNDFNSISDIKKNIEVLGQLVGEEDKAKAVVASMNRQLQGVLMAVKGHHKLRVLDYSSYGYAAGRHTTVNDIIFDAGGINAAKSLNGWQAVTDEEIVKLNPDVIIDSSDDASFLTKMQKNPAFQNVAAIQNHRLYAINGADLSSVSQYITRGVADVAKLLYPKAKLPK
jgi:iron complex transport system substrate-binding protein